MINLSNQEFIRIHQINLSNQEFIRIHQFTEDSLLKEAIERLEESENRNRINYSEEED